MATAKSREMFTAFYVLLSIRNVIEVKECAADEFHVGAGEGIFGVRYLNYSIKNLFNHGWSACLTVAIMLRLYDINNSIWVLVGSS